VRRVGLIAAAAIGVVAIAGAMTWLVAFRDTAEPVSIAEAVTSFRSDTEPAPGAATPIREGVYVYATHGFERTDALTGVTHRYPERTTVTVAASDCGFALVWRVLNGRSTAWTICVTDAGWNVSSQDERHTFFGHTERTTYLCDDAPIRPTAPAAGSRWATTCSTDKAEERGVVSVLGDSVWRLGETPFEVDHVRETATFTGAIRGASRYDFWFHRQRGVPVKIAMKSRTTNGSPIGDVHYEEDVTLRLVSLEPRR
jgi:hypothetical protein